MSLTDGSPFLWVVSLPENGEDNDAVWLGNIEYGKWKAVKEHTTDVAVDDLILKSPAIEYSEAQVVAGTLLDS